MVEQALQHSHLVDQLLVKLEHHNQMRPHGLAVTHHNLQQQFLSLEMMQRKHLTVLVDLHLLRVDLSQRVFGQHL
jgi:hypothetical protein